MDRFTYFRIIGAAALGLGGIGLGTTMHLPALAAAEYQQFAASLITCSSTSPCQQYDNTNMGPGLRGTSAKGNGLEGWTNANNGAGVEGTDSTLSFLSFGVKGFSNKGAGVEGVSGVNGVVGKTSNPSSTTGFRGTGVSGIDASTDGGNGNIGVFGFAPTAVGVEGRSVKGEGVLGISTDRAGVDGGSTKSFGVAGVSGINFGVEGETHSDSFGVRGEGITSSHGNGVLGVGQSFGVFGIGTNSDGVFAESAANVGSGPLLFSAALGIQGAGTGPLIIANNASTGDKMSLDESGNMILAGSLTQFGTPLMLHRVSKGLTVGTYTAQTTQPITEDFGEGQLVDGRAYVRLEAGFASVTQRGMAYLVFLTPLGDTKGLYVAQKTAAGFTVCEAGGGHAGIAFDYRIVAMAADAVHPRLPQLRDSLYRGKVGLPATLQRGLRILHP